MKRSWIDITLTVSLAVLAIFVPGSGGHAAEDGGTRSVFAWGTGTRALAMGGAYSAVANDASAPSWNAAGLGLLTRYELQASHANLYGLGFNEQFAFVGLPSWRFGTLGFSFRRFGVGGIEARDQQNQLVDDDLTRSESEIAIAYGRSLGAAWNFGLTTKLRRLSFAGFNDSGLGVDVGLLARPAVALRLDDRWAERFQLGLSVRNLARPTIRLQEDSVPDPLGLRIGASYLAPFSDTQTLLFALDLEKTDGMNSHLHAGMELRLHPMFALRTGFNRNGFAAGTSVRFQDFSVEYVFEDNGFDSVQRLGLSMHFGLTTQERRQLALQVEEAALQAKLAEAFELRQQTRVAELLEEARVAAGQNQLDEALEILATVDILQPDHPVARQLTLQTTMMKARVLEEKKDYVAAATTYAQILQIEPQNGAAQEAVKRCHDLSHRRAQRSQQLRQQFAAALDAFAAGDLRTARDGFARIVRLDNEDREAAAMLTRTETAIARRTADLLDQARQLIRAGALDESQAVLERAHALDPKTPGLERVLTLLKRTRQAISAPGKARTQTREDTAPQVPDLLETASRNAVLTEHEKRERAELYRRGMDAMEAGRSQEAVRYWEVVWSMDPDYQQVRESLKQYYLMQGMEAFANRQLEEAISTWDQALRVAPADEKVIDYLSMARERLMKTRSRRGETD